MGIFHKLSFIHTSSSVCTVILKRSDKVLCRHSGGVHPTPKIGDSGGILRVNQVQTCNEFRSRQTRLLAAVLSSLQNAVRKNVADVWLDSAEPAPSNSEATAGRNAAPGVHP
jgi:hypothetical protein